MAAGDPRDGGQRGAPRHLGHVGAHIRVDLLPSRHRAGLHSVTPRPLPDDGGEHGDAGGIQGPQCVPHGAHNRAERAGQERVRHRPLLPLQARRRGAHLCRHPSHLRRPPLPNGRPQRQPRPLPPLPRHHDPRIVLERRVRAHDRRDGAQHGRGARNGPVVDAHLHPLRRLLHQPGHRPAHLQVATGRVVDSVGVPGVLPERPARSRVPSHQTFRYQAW
mmetsp:Transcript_27325/g.47156  ORF Transcript_27325/g.47156 Transcript_27325/m.47156 type:complete len:219 (+) Transcript_27325:658-1314(+)